MAVKKAAIFSSMALVLAAPAAAVDPRTETPVNLLPPVLQTPAPAQQTAPQAPAANVQVATPVPAKPAPYWSMGNASALLFFIQGIASRGLNPADYGPDALQAAIKAGEGQALNDMATLAFTQLLVDLRDGRTPYSARVQWFIRDPDATTFPTDDMLRKALDSQDF